MSPPVLSLVDHELIESVLGMRSGYVLKLSDAKFAEFMRQYGIEIDDARYRINGDSKANRFRVFLNTAPTATLAEVLESLLALREIVGPEGLRPEDAERYSAICKRLTSHVEKAAAPLGEEAALFDLVFRPDHLTALPFEPALIAVLSERMVEARACVASQAYLAAVIIAGSVLEGLCLGYGKLNMAAVNRTYGVKYQKAPPRFSEWKLVHWIEVLAELGVFAPNVARFGQVLRDFRNYIHPSEQLANGFSPDRHTASIGVQVVVAAIDDLARATAPATEPAS